MRTLERLIGRAAAWTLIPGILAAGASRAQESAGVPEGAPPAAELAARLQTRYDGIRDFSADFSQTYRGGVLRKTTTERGTVLVKKPGRMRWTYTSPEDKVFVADGQKMFIYVPADRQVMVRPMPSGDAATTPIMFLLGRGNVTRDFQAEYTRMEGAPAGTWSLKLTPRHQQPEYEWLALVLDSKSLQLRMLVAQDGQGGTSSFTFTNLKENVGTADKSFSFRIPRGVDVITEG